MIVPSLANAGRSLASDSAVVSGRMPSSSLITIGSPLRCGIDHRGDLLGEVRRSSARRRPAGGWPRANASCSARVMPCRAPCRSVDSPIEQQSQASVSPSSAMWSLSSHVAVLVAGALAEQQVRGVGHRLHAAGHHDVELAGPDELVGQGDRVQAGEADLVDGQRRHGHRDAGLDRRLAGRDLPGAGLQHLAHDHVLHLVGRDAGALQRGLDRDAAELGRREVLEVAQQPAHRGPRAADDHRMPWRSPPRRGADLSRLNDCSARLAPWLTNSPVEPAADYVTGIGLRRIDHVGIAVADLDAAIDFYQRIFGMRCVHTETNEEQGVREAMLAVGPTADGRLRATARAADPGVDDREVPRPQRAGRAAGGVHGRATSTRPARRCASAACGCSTTTPRRGTAGSRVNFVHPKDAGGVLVELVEPVTLTPAAPPPATLALTAARSPVSRGRTIRSDEIDRGARRNSARRYEGMPSAVVRPRVRRQ